MIDGPRTHWEHTLSWFCRDWGRQLVFAACYVPAIGAGVLQALARSGTIGNWAPVGSAALLAIALLFGVVSAFQCHVAWRRGVCDGNEQLVPLGATGVLTIIVTTLLLRP